MKYLPAALIAIMVACGPSRSIPENSLQLTGTTQVMAVGTRSETVVFEDYRTGERYALVGDLASELVPLYGLPVAVTAVPTEQGYSMDPDLQKLELIEYTVLTSLDDYYE